jgi:hypothetical protein
MTSKPSWSKPSTSFTSRWRRHDVAASEVEPDNLTELELWSESGISGNRGNDATFEDP